MPSEQTVSEGTEAVFEIIAMGLSDIPYSVVFRTRDGTAQGIAIIIMNRMSQLLHSSKITKHLLNSLK